MRFAPLFLAATAAWATHGLLDVFTSYGTHWLWPFSGHRLAWDWVGIIDLFVTLPLLVGLILAMRKRTAKPAAIGLALAMVYIGYGSLQHYRAAAVQELVAQARGHQVTRSRVIPSPLTLSLWRSIYVSQGQLWADAIHVGPFSTTGVWPGGKVDKQQAVDMQTKLGPESQQLKDIQRFERFSDGYMYCAEPTSCLVMGDFRYAQLPNGLETLWGIRLDPQKPNHKHVERVHFTNNFSARLPLYWDMIRNQAPGLITLENLDIQLPVPADLARFDHSVLCSTFRYKNFAAVPNGTADNAVPIAREIVDMPKS